MGEGISTQENMRLKITLTEDDVLELLAKFVFSQLNRPADPADILDLDVQGDGDEFMTFEVETSNLGPKAQ
jgi:hypothetical protein